MPKTRRTSKRLTSANAEAVGPAVVTPQGDSVATSTKGSPKEDDIEAEICRLTTWFKDTAKQRTTKLREILNDLSSKKATKDALKMPTARGEEGELEWDLFEQQKWQLEEDITNLEKAMMDVRTEATVFMALYFALGNERFKGKTPKELRHQVKLARFIQHQTEEFGGRGIRPTMDDLLAFANLLVANDEIIREHIKSLPKIDTELEDKYRCFTVYPDSYDFELEGTDVVQILITGRNFFPPIEPLEVRDFFKKDATTSSELRLDHLRSSESRKRRVQETRAVEQLDLSVVGATLVQLWSRLISDNECFATIAHNLEYQRDLVRKAYARIRSSPADATEDVLINFANYMWLAMKFPYQKPYSEESTTITVTPSRKIEFDMCFCEDEDER
jgi:hypothetical protein